MSTVDITKSLQKQLPEFVSAGPVLSDVFTRDADELEQATADRLDTFEQMFIDHGAWGLKFWEVFLGIDIDETLSDDVRRARIKAKIIAGSQVFTLKQLVDVLAAYGYTVANIIEKTAEYIIEVQVPNIINTVNELLSLGRYLRIVFPAHLNLKISTVNKSVAAMINVSEIGPILTVRYDSDVYVLGTDATKQLTNITKYQVFDNEIVKSTVVNVAANYPNYIFDVDHAAAHYSGKIYIPCVAKATSTVKLATPERNFTVTDNDIVHKSLIDGMYAMAYNDASAQVVKTTKRVVLANRTTGTALYQQLKIRCKSNFLYELKSIPWTPTDLNNGPTDGLNIVGLKGNADKATLTYQYFDKDSNAISNIITPDFTFVETTNNEEEFILSGFPANAHSVEFVLTVNRPARIDYVYPSNGQTYRHVLTWADLFIHSEIENRVLLTDQSFNMQYFAAIDMNTGTATFYDIHDKLGIPMYDQYFRLGERFTRAYLKMHVDEATNSLYAICGYGLGFESNGAYGNSSNNKLMIARIDRTTMSVIDKKTLESFPVFSPYDGTLEDDPAVVPAYTESTVNDYIAGCAERVHINYGVRRHTSFVDPDFIRNFYIVHGYNGDYLVSYSRKVKYHTYDYRFTSYVDPAKINMSYLGSAVKRPSASYENIRYPSIQIVNLTTFAVKNVESEDLLELARTSCCVRDIVRDPFGPTCLKVSESKAYGLPLVFPAVRPVWYSKPPINGSGADDTYNVPVPPLTGGYAQLNGHKFTMMTLDKESLGLNVRFDYIYNNFGSVNFDPPKEKVPVYPTNIMPDLTLWMDTAYDLSKDGNPSLYVGPTTSEPSLNYLYYASYFGSFYYPYKKSAMAYTQPFDGSVVTSAKVYATVNGTPATRYSSYGQLFTGHATRDDYGLGNAVYAIYDTSAISAGGVGNTQSWMGKKLVRIIKVPYNTYQIFDYV